MYLLDSIRLISSQAQPTSSENQPVIINLWQELAIVASVFVIFNGLMVGTPLVAKAVMANRIMPLVVIGETKIGGKTVRQAEVELFKKHDLNKHLITVRYRSDAKQVSLARLGLKENIKAEVAEAYEIGRTKPLFGNYRIDPRFEVNQNALASTISELFNIKSKSAKDADLVIEKASVKVIPGEAGYDISWSEIAQKIKTIALNHQTELSLAIEPISPNITEEELVSVKDQIKKWLDTPLGFEMDGKSTMVTREIISQWIILGKKNGQVNASIDVDKIDEYVATLAKKYNRKPKNELRYEDGEVVQEGVNGREIIQAELSQELQAQLTANLPNQIIVGFKDLPFEQKIMTRGYTAGLFDGKYLEVNLSEQRMYLFEGQNQVGSYLVSTGKWSMPTPEGEFAINNKVEVAYSARYRLYMPKWMSFIGSTYGIHGLPYWASGYVEGEDHLGKPVSHGCIRLSHVDVAKVYEWADIGTKVYIHK